MIYGAHLVRSWHLAELGTDFWATARRQCLWLPLEHRRVNVYIHIVEIDRNVVFTVMSNVHDNVVRGAKEKWRHPAVVQRCRGQTHGRREPK